MFAKTASGVTAARAGERCMTSYDRQSELAQASITIIVLTCLIITRNIHVDEHLLPSLLPTTAYTGCMMLCTCVTVEGPCCQRQASTGPTIRRFPGPNTSRPSSIASGQSR